MNCGSDGEHLGSRLCAIVCQVAKVYYACRWS